jgi:hypothetical protein
MHGRIYGRLLATIAGVLAPFRGNSRTPSDERVREIASLRFRLGGVLLLRECLRLFFAWMMIWAAAVVGLRAVFRVDPFVLLWGLLGLAAAAAAGVVLARRKVPSSAALRAVLDRHGRLGGLLMAAGDTDIGAWRQQIARVPLPALKWRSGRQWMLLMTSAAFLVAAFLAPDRYLPSGSATVLQIGGEVQKLTDKIQVLKQEQILSPEKAQVLERDLDRVRQEAVSKDPAKTMEAIDHLEQSLSKAAADVAEAAVKQTETASRTQELAEALQAAQGQMDPKQFSEAMKELAHMAAQAAADSKDLDDSLSAELKEACRQGTLTDEQLRDLCQALKECKACERARLANLINAKLVDAAELADCDKAGECDEAALIDALCQCKNGKQLSEAMASCNLAGRGGPGGGGPPAVMSWQQEVNKEGAAFKEKVLQPAAASLKKSRLAGISVGNPTSAKAGGGSSGGALGAAQAGGGEARTQIILPEYEKTIQRYFEREQK